MTNLNCGNVNCKVYELQCYHAFHSLINTQELISEAKLWTVAALRRVLNDSQTYFCSQSWWLHWQIWWHLMTVAWAKGFSTCITMCFNFFLISRPSLFVAWAWELFPLTALQDQLSLSTLTLQWIFVFFFNSSTFVWCCCFRAMICFRWRLSHMASSSLTVPSSCNLS